MKNYYLTEELQRNGLFEVEAKTFFNKYFDLTGKEFPAFDQVEWRSLDDWLVDLKLAVYREQALKAIYGSGPDYCSAVIVVPKAVC